MAEEASTSESTEQAPDLPSEAYSNHDLLRGPDPLTAEEASALLAKGPGRVVVWAGERGSGKTTLTAELYERHRLGTAATGFVGSRTLLGFEERMHPARADSGRIIPHTTRTEADPEGRDLLHLEVEPPDTHLLFADLPGESFRAIRDNEISPDQVPYLAQADKVAILVDGALLADLGERSFAINTTRQLIERLSDDSVSFANAHVCLVLTKLDELQAAGDSAVRYWDEREADILAAVQDICAGSECLRTAARGKADEDGMEALMEWLLAPPPEAPEPALPAQAEPASRMLRLRSPKGLSQ